MAKIGKEYIDDLTGVYNRRYLQKIQKEVEEFQKGNIPFSVTMVDIDYFKEVNDTYGHQKGDTVIKEFSQFLKGALRITDTVVRYGGDEFICMMPNTSRQDAERVCERILRRCKEMDFGELNITISVGISSYPNDSKDFEELLKIADEYLYDAKRSGRDRIGTLIKKRVEIPIKVFINRIKEKEGLEQFVTNNTNRIRVAILKGYVGIGKTRLAKEVLSNTRDREIIWSDCLSFAENIAYYSIREAINYHLKRQVKGILAEIPLVYKVEIGKLIPEVMEGIEEKIEGVGLVSDRYRLYEGIRRIMETGEREKIVVIDNIQWIDQESIEVIKYLMRTLKNNSIAFIFIYRTEEKTELLEDFLSYISREIEVTEIELQPFEYRAIKDSLKLIIGEEPEKKLLEYIVSESGGDPFYIEEITKKLVDGQYLMVVEEKWKFKEPESELVPKSIEDIAMRKYRNLSKEAQEVLEIASVIGNFDALFIKEITGYNEGHITGLINDIGRAGLMKYTKDRVKFIGEISRSAIYKRTVEGIKRIELHRKVGDEIEKRNRGKEYEVVEELAFHYYKGQQKEKGISYCIDAGDKAKDKYANSNAIKYYTWALELLSDEKGQENIKKKIDCLIKHADVLYFIGESNSALENLENALKQAIEIENEEKQAIIKHKKVLVYHFISQYRNAIHEATECMVRHAGIINRDLMGKLILTKGSAYYGLGENEKALKHFEDALEIFKEIEDKSSESRTLGNIGNIYYTSGDYTKALSIYKGALGIFREIGDKDSEAKSLGGIGNIYSKLGDYTSVVSMYEDSLKIFREIGNKEGESRTLTNYGYLCAKLGDYYKALRFYEEALEIKNAVGDKEGKAVLLTNISECHHNMGSYDIARKYIEDALSITKEVESGKVVCLSLLSMGKLYLTLAEMDKAEEFIDKAYKLARNSDLLERVLRVLCDFYLMKKDFKKFLKTIATAEDLFKETKSKRFEGKINILLGRYYTANKDFDKANKYLHEALNIFEEFGEKLIIGRIYYYLGVMELARDSKSWCKEYLNKALKIFDSMGAKGWKERTQDTLQKEEV